MSVFEISAVIKINEEGITYIDNNQDEQFTDFKKCGYKCCPGKS